MPAAAARRRWSRVRDQADSAARTALHGLTQRRRALGDAGPGADVPPDVWRLVAHAMEPRAWARACGAARSMFAARARIARARPSSTERCSGWAIEQWPSARSLCLDLRAVADPPRLPGLPPLPGLPGAADGGASNGDAAASAPLRGVLPALQCLHIINDSGDDAAAALTLLLGRMALPALRVLSLDVALLRPLPHALAGLQHLVLRVGGDAAANAADAQPGHGLFSTIAGSLPALRTLYLAAVVPCCIPGPADLTPCGQLGALALAAIHVEAGMAVPAGCHVAAVLPADAVRALRVWTGDFGTGAALQRVDALDVRGVRTSNDALARSGLRALSSSIFYECLTALHELRIVLDFASLPGGVEDRVSLKITSACLPALRVLEVDVPCTLSLRLAWVPELRTMVLKARAFTDFQYLIVPCVPRWAAIFVRSAAAPTGPDEESLRDLICHSFCDATGEAGCGAISAGGEGGAWQGAVPAGFRPGDAPSCGCRACMDCLGRAGVPLAAAQAWQREGFDRLLAPLCR